MGKENEDLCVPPCGWPVSSFKKVPLAPAASYLQGGHARQQAVGGDASNQACLGSEKGWEGWGLGTGYLHLSYKNESSHEGRQIHLEHESQKGPSRIRPHVR